MALSDIRLPAGKIIVIKANSTLTIAAAGKALNFGTVQRVSDLCEVAEAGSSLWFDVNTATPFMIISGQTFYMIDEKDIIGSETALP